MAKLGGHKIWEEITITMLHYAAIVTIRKWKSIKNKWQDFTHFSTKHYWYLLGVKMQIFNQKNNICTSVVQNIGYFCKKLELLDWQHWNFSHMQMKSCPEKDQKTIFLSVEQFIVKTQFEISKYLISILMSSSICGGRFGRSVQLVPKTCSSTCSSGHELLSQT